MFLGMCRSQTYNNRQSRVGLRHKVNTLNGFAYATIHGDRNKIDMWHLLGTMTDAITQVYEKNNWLTKNSLQRLIFE